MALSSPATRDFSAPKARSKPRIPIDLNGTVRLRRGSADPYDEIPHTHTVERGRGSVSQTWRYQLFGVTAQSRQR